MFKDGGTNKWQIFRNSSNQFGIYDYTRNNNALLLNPNGDMYIAPGGGNVGIGTTSPGSTLTVNGVIESKSGGIKFPDGTVQTSAASTSSGTNGLGAWQTKSLSTIYQATTDGLVVATIVGTSNWGSMTGYTDSNSSPTTIRGYASQDYSRTGVDRTAFTMPVKAGDHWKVTPDSAGLNGTATINWIPMSAGANSMWQASSTNLYYNSGNVGIGTTTPTERLDVGTGNVKMGYQQVNASCPSINSATQCTVSCGAGKYVTGGGCHVNGSDGTLRLTRPIPDNQWQCYHGNSDNRTVDVYAICMNVR